MIPCYRSADILLPDFKTVDPYRWATVACDQFTSEPEYWDDAESIIGDAPSTLRVFLPEARLDRTEAEIPVIQSTMKRYLSDLWCAIPMP